MKYKRTLIFLFTTVVIAFAVFVFVALFSVKDIDISYSVYGGNEYDCMSVLEKYKGRNLLFLDENEVKRTLEAKTALKIDEVKKIYPSTVRVCVSTRQERFALSDGQGGYYILDDEYSVVAKRDNVSNHTDKLDNVIVKFSVPIDLDLSVRKKPDFTNPLFACFKTAADSFLSPRDEIREIYIYETEEKGNFRVSVSLRIGVRIVLYKAGERTQEKMDKAIEKLASLGDTDKLSGEIICLERENGEIFAAYTTH